jgi:hypothetical protein
LKLTLLSTQLSPVLTARTSRDVSLAAAKTFIQKMVNTFFQLLSPELRKKCEPSTIYNVYEKKKKLHGLSPRANYTDRATADNVYEARAIALKEIGPMYSFLGSICACPIIFDIRPSNLTSASITKHVDQSLEILNLTASATHVFNFVWSRKQNNYGHFLDNRLTDGG